jgi:hypothetical protein
METGEQQAVSGQARTQFKPGQSGNPAGRAKLTPADVEARRLARIAQTRVVEDVQAELTRAVGVAIDKLIELVDSKDENVALRAATDLLSRVNGSPVATTIMAARVHVADGRPDVIPISDVARHILSLRREFETIAIKELSEGRKA